MNNNSIVFAVFFTILLCITFPSQISAKTIRCHPDDKKALFAIYAAILSSSWDPNGPFVQSFPDCCDWNNIRCDENPPYRVIFLDIFQTTVSSPIPAAVGDLPYLQFLRFHHITNLTGTIPHSITKLTNLEELIINYANLSGPIPTFLTKLKKLNFLDLSFNNLTGSIPPEFSQFKNLDTLFLDRNKLTGTIPESFGHFSQRIQYIDLSHNHLTGTIPESLGNLNITFQLDLSRNNLTGDASFLLGKNKSIQSLDVSRNNLTFDLSNVEFPLSLRYLTLDHNKIFGSLPQQLTQLQLESLDVSYNRLCGEIPQRRKPSDVR